MLSVKELKELTDKISDPDERFYKGVLYGNFGKRKTTTALRCSRSCATISHVDRGWNVALNFPDEFDLKPGGNVIPIEYEGLTQLKALIEAVMEKQEPFDRTDLIILDTVSQMQEKYIDFLGENFDIFGREKAVPKKAGGGLKEISLTGLPDYHLTRNKMRPVIELLVRAPIDVLFLAHVREPNPMEIQKGMTMRRPNVTEAVFNLLARDATFIGYMEHKKQEGFTIDFTPTARQVAKSQIPTLTDRKIKTNELPQYLWDWKDGK